MTVIAYKNGTIAVDRGSLTGSVMHRIEKYRIIRSGKAVAIATGNGQAATMLLDWASRTGCNPDDYPSRLRGAPCEAHMIVMETLEGGTAGIFRYENGPQPVCHGKEACAFGEGQDFAYGAMYQGASAVDAVKAACFYSPYCAGPIDHFYIRGNGSIEHGVTVHL